jgi:hypothetical protein
MSHINDILTQLETNIRADSTYANADIYSHEELTSDPLPNDIAVYVYPASPFNVDTELRLRLRAYPINMLIVFNFERRATDEAERDVLTERKSDLFDSMMAIITPTTVTNVYHIEGAGYDFNFEPNDLIKEDEKRKELNRIMITIDCFTGETI